MIDKIHKYEQTNKEHFDFSVLIPTWNNLPYLQLCIDSLRKNSNTHLQIIVLVNEGKDGTLEWLKQQTDIDYIHASENLGICYGLNLCRSLIKSDYIIYLNDDMYILPMWDKILQEEITALPNNLFMLSATLIEPIDTGNPCVVVKNYGNGVENFQEIELLKEFQTLRRNDWCGSTWPPNVVHIDLWDLIGGLSVEFSPGMYSDPDFSKKIYDAGVESLKEKVIV